MKQEGLPFEPKPVCIFCLTEKGKYSKVSVELLHMDDSQGTHFARVVFPVCPDHDHIPTIHDRRPGAKP